MVVVFYRFIAMILTMCKPTNTTAVLVQELAIPVLHIFENYVSRQIFTHPEVPPPEQ